MTAANDIEYVNTVPVALLALAAAHVAWAKKHAPWLLLDA